MTITIPSKAFYKKFENPKKKDIIQYTKNLKCTNRQSELMRRCSVIIKSKKIS